jgi:Arc/MetJ family transcription regulator
MRAFLASRIMRTTIDIDDPILQQLKALQGRDGRSLGRLVSDLLAQALASEVKEAAPQYFVWTASAGSLRVDLADKDALYEALDETQENTRDNARESGPLTPSRA